MGETLNRESPVQMPPHEHIVRAINISFFEQNKGNTDFLDFLEEIN